MATAPLSVADVAPPDAKPPHFAHQSRLAFLLLGPLEVWADGRALELRRRKQRLLLALLLLRPREAVSTDRLVEDIWHGQPPRAAIGSLQNLVSELRKLLGNDVVSTREAGYALDVERDCVDLHRFTGLVSAAHDDTAAETRSERLREALALWRGSPLADFACEPFAQVEILRLEELRAGAHEELAEAELELGHHARLVGELEALVAAHPLRERLRAQLMLAYYRSGRQTAALAAFQDARRTLADELGLEPSAELRRLERAILVHDPSLLPDRSVTPPVGSGIEFRVLGPLEVRSEGRPIGLGRTKQRALLAFLLLHANRVVSRDQLIDALWGEKPPETAATAVHGYVSGLRKSIGADRIETRSPGYVLRAGAEELDLAVFQRLHDEARPLEPAKAAERLEQALAMWRGDPFADFDSVPFVTDERSRLEELHLCVLEDRTDALLALGRHVEVIAELQALVRSHPLRERLRAQLMLALYRSGRQAEALEVYQQGRRLLAEELGLEPGESLKRLQHAMLAQDPALDGLAAPHSQPEARRTRPADLPARPLLGRSRFAAALVVVILAAVAAGVAVALSRGSEPGVTVVSNSVAIVDSETNDLVGDVPVGGRPVALAFGEGAVWVANSDDDTVVRIDARSRRIVDEIRVGTDVRDIATGFGSVWVADGTHGTLTRIDLRPTKVTTLRVGEGLDASPREVSWVAMGRARSGQPEARPCSRSIRRRTRWSARPPFRRREDSRRGSAPPGW